MKAALLSLALLGSLSLPVSDGELSTKPVRAERRASKTRNKK
jgi:hypothetical protein